MADWSRVATRIRVPLGFAFALAYLWFARPTWASLAVCGAITVIGLVVRAAASGHIRKNAQLAVTGPYAYTRNPLYLGSLLVALGFIIAARNWWIALAACIMFFLIYLPVIRAEEAFLRSTFTDYADYAAHVPRLLPRLTAFRSTTAEARAPAGFSRELFWKHREYNAALGATLMMIALAARILWFPR
jgi:protein-S-isoprenylcysteine O-methyltransferase Ste14